jgi:hypothetical protein
MCGVDAEVAADIECDVSRPHDSAHDDLFVLLEGRGLERTTFQENDPMVVAQIDVDDSFADGDRDMSQRRDAPREGERQTSTSAH